MTGTHNTIAITVCTSILCISCEKPVADGGTATTPTADCATGTGTGTGTTPTGTTDSGWTEKELNNV